jgi:hypothetical protein
LPKQSREDANDTKKNTLGAIADPEELPTRAHGLIRASTEAEPAHVTIN